MAAREKAPKAAGEVRTFEYLAPGVAPDVEREPFTIDPELEEVRDREAEVNSSVDISAPREEISIDPVLVKARDEQIKREGGKPSTPPADEPKKAAAKKSSK